MKFLAWHLGLGDAIICAGLVSRLAKDQTIIVPCYEHNYVSVKSFFNGLNVLIETVKSDRDVIELVNKYDAIRLGYFRNQNMNTDFVTQFYNDAEIDYEERYDSCPLLEASHDVGQVEGSKKTLVCNSSSGGVYKINGISKEYMIPYSVGSILAWRQAITNADEIHCIDSAMLHLVEQLAGPKTKLFYHKYARPNSPNFNFKNNWNVLTK